MYHSFDSDGNGKIDASEIAALSHPVASVRRRLEVKSCTLSTVCAIRSNVCFSNLSIALGIRDEISACKLGCHERMLLEWTIRIE